MISALTQRVQRELDNVKLFELMWKLRCGDRCKGNLSKLAFPVYTMSHTVYVGPMGSKICLASMNLHGCVAVVVCF